MKRRGLLAGTAAGLAALGLGGTARAQTPGRAAVCQARIVAASEVSDRLYLVGYNGNEITWNGTTLSVNGWGTSVTNAGLNPNTLYYVYVYSAGGAPALELSQTGHAPDASWNECKAGDSTRLLMGMVYTDPAGKFTRSPQRMLILNWHNRLPLFAAPPAAGIACTSPTWQELGSLSQNVVEILTWGYQLGIAENLVIGVSGSAAMNQAGGRCDLVFGDLAIGPDLPVSSWVSVTSAAAGQWQNVSGASTIAFPEGRHAITFWGRTYSGAQASIYVNTFASTNG